MQGNKDGLMWPKKPASNGEHGIRRVQGPGTSSDLFRGGHAEPTGSAHGGRHGSHRPRGCRTAVVGHVCAYEMAGRQRRTETELTGEDGGRNDAGQLPGILSWCSGVGPTDT